MRKLNLSQMSQVQYSKLEAIYAFARAIAFANLDLASPECRWDGQVQNDENGRHRPSAAHLPPMN